MTYFTEKVSDQDYRLLGLKPGASQDEVKRAYRDLVKLWHPDAHQQCSPLERTRVEEKFKEITSAYRRISLSWKHREPSMRPPRKESTTHARPEPPPGPKAEPGSEGGGGARRPENSRGHGTRFKPKTSNSQYRSRPDLTASAGDMWRAMRSTVAPLAGFFRRHAPGRASFKLDKNSAAALLFLLLLAFVFSLATIPVQNWYNSRIDLQPLESVPQHQVEPPPPGPQVDEHANDSASQVKDRSDNEPQPPAAKTAPASGNNYQAGEGAFFTLGSSQAEVLKIQGAPTRVQGQTWVYGLSDIQFREGRVWKYNNFDNSLKVQILPSSVPKSEPPEFFSLGSDKDEVLHVQGTPTRIETGRWFYGLSEIRFRDGRVEEYDNYFGSLKIRVVPSNPSLAALQKHYFTIGSTKDEVLVLQGTPTSIQGSFWSYQNSNVFFRDGKVQHVLNTGGNLLFVPPEELTTRQAGSS